MERKFKYSDFDVIQANRKAIGNTYYVLSPRGGWFGVVKDVLDKETFLVHGFGGQDRKVNIYDMRFWCEGEMPKEEMTGNFVFPEKNRPEIVEN